MRRPWVRFPPLAPAKKMTLAIVRIESFHINTWGVFQGGTSNEGGRLMSMGLLYLIFLKGTLNAIKMF